MLNFRELEGEKGITTMALVITIIILLILAGISVAGLTGENGLIANAVKAKEQTEIDSEKEIIETATIQAMGKDKYGDITVEGLQKELQGKATVEKIRKKIVVTINNSQRTYYVDDSGNVFEYEYFDLAIMENGLDFSSRMADYKTSIVSVTVLDNMKIPENVYQVFDVSKDQNETVKAWLVENKENTDMYDLYIGGNDGVEIQNCNAMFSYYSNCISIDVSNLYTSNVKSFAGMFSWDSKLQEINLSNMDTSNATEMNSMFNKCLSLANLDVSNFDTSNVFSMSLMFYDCPFSTIDVSNFDTTKVKFMNAMFRQCDNLQVLDLSGFDTSSLERTDNMFYSCKKLKSIYVSDKWVNDKITKSDNMFYNCISLEGKINYDSTKIDILYANYNNGYFTYKAVEMSSN